MFSLLLQGLPPIPDGSQLDLGRLLINIALAIVWTVVAGVSFAVAISIGVRLFEALLPGLDYLAELKKGNLAVAAVLGVFMISLTAIVVAILLK
jgi:hypothetical protein